MNLLRSALLSIAPLALCLSVFAQGRIVVAHDEWTLSNSGFNSGPSAGQYAQNVAAWFTGGQPGNFRAWSNDFGLTQSSLAQAMTSAGHTWTVSTSGTFDLATLQQYDGVFIGVTPNMLSATVLTQYVNGGGNVYVCAGGGGPSVAANAWNPFLANFGLAYSNVFNNMTELFATNSAHPIFAGVPSLYHNNGNSISETNPPVPGAQVLLSKLGQGLYAVFDGGAIATTYCTAKTNSLGCTPSIGSSGIPSASSATPFTIHAVNVLNQKQGLLFYGYSQQSAPFQGGFLCMAPPTRRTPTQNSGGAAAPVNDCSGVYGFDFNAWIQSGVDPFAVAGQEIDAQFWSRDPASPSTTGLTNALSFVIGS